MLNLLERGRLPRLTHRRQCIFLLCGITGGFTHAGMPRRLLPRTGTRGTTQARKSRAIHYNRCQYRRVDLD